VLTLACLVAFARTVIEADPAVSLALADHVVVATIESARELKAGAMSCGAQYRAKVVANQKGVLAAGQVASFGFFGGLEVGTTYNLYLFNDPHGDRMAQLMSERDAQVPEIKPLITSCRHQWAGFTFFRADRTSGSR
jgi:hypothetical protein